MSKRVVIEITNPNTLAWFAGQTSSKRTRKLRSPELRAQQRKLERELIATQQTFDVLRDSLPDYRARVRLLARGIRQLKKGESLTVVKKSKTKRGKS